MNPTKTLAAAFALALAATSAGAQTWPNGPVQIIIPSRPGGGTDIMGRIFADYLQRATGASVAVINQPEGGGTVAQESVRTSAPDGQTLLFQHTGMLVAYQTGRYDHPVSDFTTLGIAQSYPPQVFAVAADAPWNTMREFVDQARAHPGEYTVGVSLGGTTHFIAGTIMMNEEVDLRLVEASAEVDKVAGIQGGFITLGNLGAGSARQYVAAGDMKVLCLIDPTPNPRYPEFETCIDQGVNVSWIAPLVVWGPAGIDPAIADRINAVIRGMGDDATTTEQLASADSSFAPYTLAEADAIIEHENTTIDALARHLGLSAH
ncbi:MAG: tripartite tricarboxylate transporter substrate binding protein [Rhodobacteraceae bacterium]|nr:tripartite tricarboxylate transporter substrate binding protein [Paracoccaceae bacterium]